eukprot:TRINITY_DN70814_c0_g1_i2.p1 TRINITY_DN70814_c0_g1~~TRINITY_DN70814_c0_g1_i2.p1  ORF type:complete len:900 (-),score=147.53 TRINITY_DN70814_c0_g1_i2:171-2870(-)
MDRTRSSSGLGRNRPLSSAVGGGGAAGSHTKASADGKARSPVSPASPGSPPRSPPRSPPLSPATGSFRSCGVVGGVCEAAEDGAGAGGSAALSQRHSVGSSSKGTSASRSSAHSKSRPGLSSKASGRGRGGPWSKGKGEPAAPASGGGGYPGAKRGTDGPRDLRSPAPGSARKVPRTTGERAAAALAKAMQGPPSSAAASKCHVGINGRHLPAGRGRGGPARDGPPSKGSTHAPSKPTSEAAIEEAAPAVSSPGLTGASGSHGVMPAPYEASVSNYGLGMGHCSSVSSLVRMSCGGLKSLSAVGGMPEANGVPRSRVDGPVSARSFHSGSGDSANTGEDDLSTLQDTPRSTGHAHGSGGAFADAASASSVTTAATVSSTAAAFQGACAAELGPKKTRSPLRRPPLAPAAAVAEAMVANGTPAALPLPMASGSAIASPSAPNGQQPQPQSLGQEIVMSRGRSWLPEEAEVTQRRRWLSPDRQDEDEEEDTLLRGSAVQPSRLNCEAAEVGLDGEDASLSRLAHSASTPAMPSRGDPVANGNGVSIPASTLVAGAYVGGEGVCEAPSRAALAALAGAFDVEVPTGCSAHVDESNLMEGQSCYIGGIKSAPSGLTAMAAAAGGLRATTIRSRPQWPSSGTGVGGSIGVAAASGTSSSSSASASVAAALPTPGGTHIAAGGSVSSHHGIQRASSSQIRSPSLVTPGRSSTSPGYSGVGTPKGPSSCRIVTRISASSPVSSRSPSPRADAHSVKARSNTLSNTLAGLGSLGSNAGHGPPAHAQQIARGGSLTAALPVPTAVPAGAGNAVGSVSLPPAHPGASSQPGSVDVSYISASPLMSPFRSAPVSNAGRGHWQPPRLPSRGTVLGTAGPPAGPPTVAVAVGGSGSVAISPAIPPGMQTAWR